MLNNSFESEKLYAKTFPVSIKDGHTTESRKTNLFLTIEWLQGSAGLHRKELLISLTDNNDPFFLYHSNISEEDFQIIKRNHGLDYDFPTFPQRLINLLELCFVEERKGELKAALVLNIGENICNIPSTSILDISHPNIHCYVKYMSLKFLIAPDSSVKQYLNVCFRNLKEDNRNLQNRLCLLEKDFQDQLSVCRDSLQRKSQELEIFKKDMTAELNLKESKFDRELFEERDKFLKKHREEEIRFQKEREEKESYFKKQIQQLETKLLYIENVNKELERDKLKKEATLKERDTHILSLDEELKKTKESLNMLKRQNTELMATVQDKRQRLSHQSEKIDQLQREIRHQKQQFDKIQEQLDISQKHAKNLEKNVCEKQEELSKKERFSHNLEQDVSKANEIIKKLQFEIQTGHEKLKKLREFFTKNKCALQEKEQTINLLTKENTILRKESEKKNNKINDLTALLETLKEKINHLESELLEKENAMKQQRKLLLERMELHSSIPESAPVSLPGVENALRQIVAGNQGAVKVNKSATATNAALLKSFSLRNKVSGRTINSDELRRKHRR